MKNAGFSTVFAKTGAISVFIFVGYAAITTAYNG
jgi:hypothetical protein